ncbi:murein DD-endopeptidase MepM/ murein hydrolase activator NlpD [Pseudomonas duriflava]|uniref:Murein DD-endopeptidase MepM/ murein hydrolase activator NlpD n=1 Tax=Pseudomonas duriflava TaxID=459528 RepID=A0A562QJC4_9PSED|nr:peptidoglycan DD-metalloendopeptidase family protein [Pseudomonas duriflava]TWI56834.1 murein DD-endopeptidase MepM/ murein hydrolase activator NlpD [Pseudomonas duriflava]
MTQPTSKSPFYPKSHILAASGVAALLSLALLVFPSREVEAKKTLINMDISNSTGQLIQERDNVRQLTSTLETPAEPSEPASPFASISPSIEEDPETARSAPELEPAEQNNLASKEPKWKEVTVKNGDTLSTIFENVGLSTTTLHDALNSASEAKRFSQLRVGQKLEFKVSPDGQLLSLRSKPSTLETLTLSRTESGYDLKRDLAEPKTEKAYARGVIESSLFAAARRAGLSHDMTMALANVFAYDVDFALDIREGDEFEVIYEKKMVDGKRVGNGNILAARFTNRGKTYTAVRYTNKQGNTNYYTADGSSMRRAFIRTPVEFARISSRFSLGRYHPVLNKLRAHKGVDYAAPTGTPIHATGDGRIVEAGRKGGYGNAVVIQHGKRYSTVYGHMSRFAKGIRAGTSVKQGQVIGYVGMTGLATGPHLHYEFRINGTHVDPLGVKLPMADPIAKGEKQRFLAQSHPLMARMDQEKATLIALNKR